MFYSGNFTFDNITSTSMSVDLVSMNSDVLNEYGVSYIKDLNRIGKSLYSDSDEDCDTIEISLCYVDKGMPKPWTLEKRTEVISWMVKDDFKPFVSEDDPDIIYYFKCVGYRREFSSDMTGIITFKMKPFSPYVYYGNITKAMVNGSLDVDITNISNVEECFYPVLKVTSNTNQKIYINSLELEVEPGVTEIDNGTKNVFNNSGKSLISKCNRKWVGLDRGKNTLRLRGNFEVEINCIFPMMV